MYIQKRSPRGRLVLSSLPFWFARHVQRQRQIIMLSPTSISPSTRPSEKREQLMDVGSDRFRTHEWTSFVSFRTRFHSHFLFSLIEFSVHSATDRQIITKKRERGDGVSYRLLLFLSFLHRIRVRTYDHQYKFFCPLPESKDTGMTCIPLTRLIDQTPLNVSLNAYHELDNRSTVYLLKRHFLCILILWEKSQSEQVEKNTLSDKILR